jgi:hypothetical protein
MDLDDAHMLLSLADDDPNLNDQDQEELSAQVKRTKLDTPLQSKVCEAPMKTKIICIYTLIGLLTA